MTHNQRIKLLEAIKILQDLAAAGAGEQLELIAPPAVADLSGISAAMREFTKAIYRTFGMNSVKPDDNRLRGIQAETGMMRIDNFVTTMQGRNIIEATYHQHGNRKRLVLFRILKTIPQ